MNKTLNFCLLLLPEFTLLPYAGFVDKLRFSADEEDYSQQRYISWFTRILSEESVSSSAYSQHNASVLTESDIIDADYIVIFGGRDIQKMLGMSSLLAPVVANSLKYKTHLVAVDNAVFALAKCSRRTVVKSGVAVHWRHRQQFAEYFPSVPILADEPHHIGSQFSSCVGGAASIDLAIQLLTPSLGRQRAVKGLSDMITEQQQSRHYLNKAAEIPLVTDLILNRALLVMNDKLFSKTAIDHIASQVGISRRQLDRKFLKQFDLTAHDYLQNKKLSSAKWQLANTTLSVTQIAAKLGFESISHFRDKFKAQFGVLPSQTRDY